MKTRHGQRGLTLLETMFAMLIMALMAMMVSETMASGIRVIGRSALISDEISYAIARRDLRAWLEQALSQPVPDETDPLFEGEPTGFVAHVLMPDQMFWSGASTRLKLERSTFVSANGLGEEGKPIERRLQIAPEGYTVSIEYWGRLSNSIAPTWRNEWPSRFGLPTLMKITFSGDGRSIPPLTVRLGKSFDQSEMSLSSLVPPALPSRP